MKNKKVPGIDGFTFEFLKMLFGQDSYFCWSYHALIFRHTSEFLSTII